MALDGYTSLLFSLGSPGSSAIVSCGALEQMAGFSLSDRHYLWKGILKILSNTSRFPFSLHNTFAFLSKTFFYLVKKLEDNERGCRSLGSFLPGGISGSWITAEPGTPECWMETTLWLIGSLECSWCLGLEKWTWGHKTLLTPEQRIKEVI